MKDCVSNHKYFTQKSPMPFHVIFVFAVAIGALLICIGPRMYPIGFPLLFVAIIMEVIVCQRHVSDKYYETCLPKEKEKFISEFEETYRHVDDRMLHANAVGCAALSEKHGAPLYGGEYRYLPSDFEALGTEMLMRRGDDTAARSSIFCFTGLQLDRTRICLMKKFISFVDDREKVECVALPYTELASVIIETTPLTCGFPSAHCIELVFFGEEERELFRLPVHGSCSDDALVERINERIRIARKTE